MNFLKQLFEQSNDPRSNPNYSEDLSVVERQLKGLPPPQARYLACLALLLARVARVDFNVSDGEKARMRDVLTRQSHLSTDQAGLVIDLALDRAARNSVEDHIVMRHLNASVTREQKQDVLRALFHVAGDDSISEQESEEIFVIAKAMNFSRREFLELRNEFRDDLALLQKLPK